MNLTGKACIAGVMGWPVAHSRSPACHGYWLAHYGVDGAYVPLPVRPENLETALRALPLLGFAGVNVTVPHKEAALAIVDEADALATRIGAVNTVSVRSDGGLVGTNTDGFGFLENLHHGAPSWRAAAGPAVVLGAGGAARAIVAALLDAGAPEIRLVNRTATRAENLRDALAGPIRVESWAGRADALAGASLLVNATTLGMTGGEGLDLDLGQLPGAALVTDIVYVPLETPLLTAARGLGHRTVDGLGMLLHQARPGWRMWFSGAAPGGDTGPIDPEVTDALRTAVLLDMAR